MLSDANMVQGKGTLLWHIAAQNKLVPKKVKKADVNYTIEKDSRMTKGSEEDTSLKDTEDCESPHENYAETSKPSGECGRNVEKGPEIFARVEEEEGQNEVVAKTATEQIQGTCDEERQIVEDGEKTDESAALTTMKTGGRTAENGPNMDRDDGAERGSCEAVAKGVSGLLAKPCDDHLLNAVPECSSLLTTEKNFHLPTEEDEPDIVLGVADMNPEMYSDVSKLHLDPVTVKPPDAQKHTGQGSPSSRFLSTVPPEDTSVTGHAKDEVDMTDSYKVVDMDLSDGEKWEQPLFLTTSSHPDTTIVTARTESTPNGDKDTPQSKDSKMNHRLSFSESTNTCLSEDDSLPHRPSSRDGTICMQPDSKEMNFNDKITSNATLDENVTSDASMSIVTTSDMKTSTCKASPKTLESTTGTPSKAVAPPRTRTPPLATSASKNSEALSETPLLLQTKTEPVDLTKMENNEVRTEDSDKPLHAKSPMEPIGNIEEHMRKKSITSMNVRSERSTSNTNPPPQIGLSHLIAVTCDKKRQVYCQLCSIRLTQSLHPRRFSHHYKYVKSKYPDWTPLPSEKKRELAKMVSQLAEIEKKSGSKGVQWLKVNSIQYKELADLPENEAVKRVKEMMRQRTDQQDVLSTVTEPGPEALRQDMPSTSPCDSPIDDEPGSSSSEDNSVIKCAETDEPITSGPHSQSASNGDSAECITTPSIQDVSITVTEEEHFHSNEDVTATLKSPDVVQLKTEDKLNTDSTPCEEEKHSDSSHPLISDSESPRASTSTLNSCRETSDIEQQLEGSNSDLQGTSEPDDGKQTVTTMPTLDSDLESLDGSVKSPVRSRHDSDPSGGTKITSTVTSSEPELKSSENMKQPKCERTSPRDDHVLPSTQHSPGASQLRTSRGETVIGRSSLSIYLRVLNAKPVIGLGSVWECRGASMNMDTFFLCESCRKTLTRSEICKHMVSSKHHFNYMQSVYPKFLTFWYEDDLLDSMKQSLLKEVAGLLSHREQFSKIDSVVILLSQESYDFARTAPFSEALNLVQNIRKQKQGDTFSAPQQKETMRRRKSHLEEAADTDRVKIRRKSPPDVNIDSNIYSSITSHSGQMQVKCKDTAVEPSQRSQACQLSSQTQPYTQVPQEDLLSETPRLSNMFQNSSPSPSAPSRQHFFPTEVATFGAPVESLVRPSTHNTQLRDPFPAIPTRSQPESTSAMTLDNTTSAPIPLCSQDINGQPESSPNGNIDWSDLIGLLNHERAKRHQSAGWSVPKNNEVTPSCVATVSEQFASVMFSNTVEKMPTFMNMLPTENKHKYLSTSDFLPTPVTYNTKNVPQM